METGKGIRDISDVRESVLLGSLVNRGVSNAISNRFVAILETLTRIPSKDYEDLCNREKSLYWCLPEPSLLGGLFEYPVFSNVDEEQLYEPIMALEQFTDVLYLSPELEHVSREVAVAVIAHLLAHVSLGHSISLKPGPEYDKQEDEVQEILTMWGFDQQVEGLKKVTRWRNVI